MTRVGRDACGHSGRVLRFPAFLVRGLVGAAEVVVHEVQALLQLQNRLSPGVGAAPKTPLLDGERTGDVRTHVPWVYVDDLEAHFAHAKGNEPLIVERSILSSVVGLRRRRPRREPLDLRRRRPSRCAEHEEEVGMVTGEELAGKVCGSRIRQQDRSRRLVPDSGSLPLH